MPRESLVWACYGAAGVFDDLRALAACLGDGSARAVLVSEGTDFPTLDEFRCDECYDVNPHGLRMAPSQLELLLLIRVLAAWGAEALIRAALAAGLLEQQLQHDLPADCLPVREAAVRAAARFITSPTPGHRADAERAAARFITSPTPGHRADAERAAAACRDRYAPFADQPDSAEALATHRELGAAWCAVEAAAADYRLQEYDGPGPVAASCTWGNRNSVWPQRAAEAAAQWCSHEEVRQAIVRELRAWTTTRG